MRNVRIDGRVWQVTDSGNVAYSQDVISNREDSVIQLMVGDTGLVVDTWFVESRSGKRTDRRTTTIPLKALSELRGIRVGNRPKRPGQEFVEKGDADGSQEEG